MVKSKMIINLRYNGQSADGYYHMPPARLGKYHCSPAANYCNSPPTTSYRNRPEKCNFH